MIFRRLVSFEGQLWTSIALQGKGSDQKQMVVDEADWVGRLSNIYCGCRKWMIPKYVIFSGYHTAQKMKFSIKNFFSKCDQIRRSRWNS